MRLLRLARNDIFFILIGVCLTTDAWGWGTKDHHLLAASALRDVVARWNLDTTVEVRPVTSLIAALNRAGLKVADAKELALYLYINPLIIWHQIPPEEEYAKKIRIIELIIAHTTDPDDGRDKGVMARGPDGQPLFDSAGNPRPISEHQRWMAGVPSQAFRHMEKPPFSFAHISTTIGFPLGAVGEASRRAGLYYYLGLIALSQGEEYWGWRLLAGSFHYIQDLTQPYHSSQVTLPIVWKTLRQAAGPLHQKTWLEPVSKSSSFTGSCALKGLDAAVHILSNEHQFYESYLDQITLTPDKVSPLIRQAGGTLLPMGSGTELAPAVGGPVELATLVRDESNLASGRLQAAVMQLSAEKLLGPAAFDSDHVPADNPQDFVIDPANSQSLAAHQEMLTITGHAFALAGQAQRRLVDLFMKESSMPDLNRWLKNVDELRSPRTAE